MHNNTALNINLSVEIIINNHIYQINIHLKGLGQCANRNYLFISIGGSKSLN